MPKNNNEHLMFQFVTDVKNHIMKIAPNLTFKNFYQCEDTTQQRCKVDILFSDNENNDFIFYMVYQTKLDFICWSFSYVLVNDYSSNNNLLYRNSAGEILSFVEISKIFESVSHNDETTCKKLLFSALEKNVPSFFINENKSVYTKTKETINKFKKLFLTFEDTFNYQLEVLHGTGINLTFCEFKDMHNPHFQMRVTTNPEDIILENSTSFKLLLRHCIINTRDHINFVIYEKVKHHTLYNPSIVDLKPEFFNNIESVLITIFPS